MGANLNLRNDPLPTDNLGPVSMLGTLSHVSGCQPSICEIRWVFSNCAGSFPAQNRFQTKLEARSQNDEKDPKQGALDVRDDAGWLLFLVCITIYLILSPTWAIDGRLTHLASST